MVFSRFDTAMVSFTSLHDLVDGLTYSGSFYILDSGLPCTRIDFYVGNASNHTLYNLRTFFQYNNWYCDRMWKYEIVTLVAYNDISSAIVDMPLSFFPWCVDFFGATDIDMPFAEGMVANHIFHVACKECYRLKRRCTIGRSGDCAKCQGRCTPAVEKEIAAARSVFIKTLLSNRHALCPAFQHLLATCGNANGYHKIHTAEDLRDLTAMLPVAGRDTTKEDFIRSKASATQLVQFLDGRLSILEETNVGTRVRFARTAKKGRVGLATNITNFGIDDYVKAYSLINSALSNPGHIYFADAMIRNTGLVVSQARIMVLAQIESPISVFIMVGWI